MKAHSDTKPRPASESGLSERLVVLEDPAVVDRLRTRAKFYGHSLAAEVREAIRYWLAAVGDDV